MKWRAIARFFVPICRSPCGERGLKSHGVPRHRDPHPSLPVRGAWVEIKSSKRGQNDGRSLPVRGAWVEIGKASLQWTGYNRRSPCGERGLKFIVWEVKPMANRRRSPCGERGLKYRFTHHVIRRTQSLPVRGAWVEIEAHQWQSGRWRSLPVRGAWVEIRYRLQQGKRA